MQKKVSLFLKILIALLGALLAAHIIARVGWRQIASALVAHSYVVLGVSVAYVSWHLVRTWTLQICMTIRTRFSTLFAVRLAGEALAYIAVGSILGDALKVALAKRELPAVEMAKGVFAEKLIYHLAGTAFIIGGLLIAVIHFGHHRIFLYALLGMIVFFLLLFFLMSSGVQPITSILKHFPVRRPKLREAIRSIEESIFRFRKEEPVKFLLAMVLNVTTYFYSAAEVWVIVISLGYSPSFLEVWYYVAAVKAMNSASFVVPGNLGVFEATNVFLAKQIGWGQQAGILAALIVRIRAIIWAIIGYVWFLFFMAKDKKSI